MSSRNIISTPGLFVPALIAGLALVGGCLEHPIKGVELQAAAEDDTSLPLDIERKVDVLLVIDNSGSMGEEQANLAVNFAPFIEQLEQAGADYRIAVTTTDLGGPGCAGSNDGHLRLSSCADRPAQFVFDGTDQFDAACAAHCELGDADLQITPTAVDKTASLAARPWIQSFNGVSNLPEGVDPLEAFQCFAPQGISGCGWESPLEAMSRALTHMQDPSAPEYGFLRDDALLAVLIVTDEVDCSFNPALQSELFESGVFFADGIAYPTSAVCWNAGVVCDGSSPYASCVGADLGGDGQPTSESAAMVLHPVAKYIGELEGLAASKSLGREVLVSVIAGVPSGYNTGAVEQVFADSDDPSFQAKFGIGPGCSNEVDGVLQTAIPPVRLVEFADEFTSPSLPAGARNVYSVCEDDYSPAIIDIVDSIAKELPPACFPGCVLDLDLDTPELDYSCAVTASAAGEDIELQECAQGANGPELPAGADLCWVAKSGAELSSTCVEQGRNLEFEVLLRWGVELPSGMKARATCELAQSSDGECG